jgi:bacteriocin-like protein
MAIKRRPKHEPEPKPAKKSPAKEKTKRPDGELDDKELNEISGGQSTVRTGFWG